ncbi:MAG: hypothetical protein Q8K92_08080 [Leadbetterella sp.]|nr:hypothetical protein [Leadbetterella sp.]
MNQTNYPSVDRDFIISLFESADCIEGKIEAGSTIAYILKGSSYIGKRTLYIRKNIKEIHFFEASGLCIRIKKLHELTEWYKREKGFDQGEYFITP